MLGLSHTSSKFPEARIGLCDITCRLRVRSKRVYPIMLGKIERILYFSIHLVPRNRIFVCDKDRRHIGLDCQCFAELVHMNIGVCFWNLVSVEGEHCSRIV